MANLGLDISVNLRELFSPDWPEKIFALVDRLLMMVFFRIPWF